jgi:hypothetical protein
VPQWSAVAMRQAQDVIQVKLRNVAGALGVTRDQMAAALRLLTITIGLDGREASAVEHASQLEFHFVDIESRPPDRRNSRYRSLKRHCAFLRSRF